MGSIYAFFWLCAFLAALIAGAVRAFYLWQANREQDRIIKQQQREDANRPPPPAPITFACPRCQHQHRGSGTLAGSPFVCRHCKGQFIVQPA